MIRGPAGRPQCNCCAPCRHRQQGTDWRTRPYVGCGTAVPKSQPGNSLTITKPASSSIRRVPAPTTGSGACLSTGNWFPCRQGRKVSAGVTSHSSGFQLAVSGRPGAGLRAQPGPGGLPAFVLTGTRARRDRWPPSSTRPALLASSAGTRRTAADGAVRLLLRDRVPRPRSPAHRDLPHLCGGKGGKAHSRLAGRGWGVLAARESHPPRVRAEWIDRYQGTGRRGFREETRVEYRALLERYALRWFPPDQADGGRPADMADYIGWLVKQPNHRGDPLADQSIRNAFRPLSGVLATARREGLIQHNPAAEAVLPHRPTIDEREDRRPLSRSQLELFLRLVHPGHRLMLDFTARTGLRASEVLGLEGRHVHLPGSPHVKVRQRRSGGKIGPVKSCHAHRASRSQTIWSGDSGRSGEDRRRPRQ